MQLGWDRGLGEGGDLPKERVASMNPALHSMAAPAHTPKPLTVVVGFDFTDADGPAFDQAARIAQRAVRGHLHLVHVFDRQPQPERLRELTDQLRVYFNEKAAAAGGLNGLTVGIHLRSGDVVREIVQLAAEVDADVVVVGSHRGPHLRHWIVGSTAQRLLGSSSWPVIVASPWPREVEHHDPVIEPPCAECERIRATSGGSRWWCVRHAHRAAAAHRYSYQREIPFATLDPQVFPTGIEF